MSEREPSEREKHRSGTRLAWRMLSGMLSSVRCQEFLDRGDVDCARVELMALHQALDDVAELALDEAGARDRLLLRERAMDLGACIRRIQGRRAAG